MNSFWVKLNYNQSEHFPRNMIYTHENFDKSSFTRQRNIEY